MYKILLILFYSSFVYSQQVDTNSYIAVSKKTNLLEVAKENYINYSYRYSSLKEYLRDLTLWNKDLPSFTKITKGTEVYIDYPYSPHISFPSSIKLNVRDIKKEFFGFGFYTASQGTFSEKTKSGQEVESFQNSPFTLGIGGGYVPYRKSYSFASSLYWSYLTPSVTQSNSKVDEIHELGVNFYIDKPLSGGWSIYTGVDYENFATLDVAQLVTDGTTKIFKHKIGFWTFGTGKKFEKWGRPFLFKGSVSKSLFSQSGGGLTEDYAGTKFILYLNTRASKKSKLLWHMLYKQHNLKGNTDLIVRRFGLGVGWSLF